MTSLDIGALRTRFHRLCSLIPASSAGRSATAESAVARRPRRRAPASQLVATVVARASLANCAHWNHSFPAQRMDHRYYELVEDTIRQDFEYWYFIIDAENGKDAGVQPFFILDQDIAAGTNRKIRSLIECVRRFWPRFLRMRTLMVGCVAGEGHLSAVNESTRREHAQVLLSTAISHARAQNTQLIVLKEFPACYRGALQDFAKYDFVRLPSLPMTTLNIEYASFDDYMKRALSRATRKDLRRKSKAAARAPALEMSLTNDITAMVDEIYPLYLQVYERSSLRFEKLTKDYLSELGRRMPDKVRFFVWRQSERIVAFSICMVQGDTIYDEYIGLDYTVALDLHLYHYTFRDIVAWAIVNGYKWYCSTGLNYDPKLHLKCKLAPLDLYVRHTSPLVNGMLKGIFPLLGPARYDKNLSRFGNYDEL